MTVDDERDLKRLENYAMNGTPITPDIARRIVARVRGDLTAHSQMVEEYRRRSVEGTERAIKDRDRAQFQNLSLRRELAVVLDEKRQLEREIRSLRSKLVRAQKETAGA